MKKRPVILFLTGMALLAFAACGGKEEPARSRAPVSSSVSQQTAPSAGPEAPAEETPPTKSGGSTAEGPDEGIPDPGTEGEEKGEGLASPQPAPAETPAASVDVDLTELSSTMVYAEVFAMMTSPDEYVGKTIRVTGTFAAGQDPQTARVSCGVIVQDATACCSQGIDIVMPEGAVYPQDYPPAGAEVTVVGELRTDPSLEEYGVAVLRLEKVTFESAGGTP